MRVRFDRRADAIYMRLDESPVVESEEVHPGIILDFNEREEVVGVEVLCVKGRIPLAYLTKMQFEIAK